MPSARRATWQAYGGEGQGAISIHALREEGDSFTILITHLLFNFYPRPPRGGRPYCFRNFPPDSEFLSTPSARRATALPMEPSASAQISIHALREEGDLWLCLTQHTPMTFLSTPSARRATKQSCKEYTTTSNFYPRPPRGGRHHRTKLTHMDKKISIHALREEGDVGINGVSSTSPIFLSTPSARRATILWDDFKRFMGISIHALREEGDSSAKMPPTGGQ